MVPAKRIGARQLVLQQRRLLRWAVALIALASLALAALPTLFYPFTRDQGIYAYVTDVMMSGGAPFRDAWELKPPGIYFAYWCAFLLFGRSELAVRLFDVLYALISATSVYALARLTLANKRIALTAAWVYAFCYYLLVHFHSMATPEAFMAPFLVASVCGVVWGMQGKRGSWPFVLAGIGGGLVFWFKPTGGLVILAALVWAFYLALRRRWTRCQFAAAALGLGVGIVIGILPIGLYLFGHGLTELLEVWQAYGTGAYLEAGGLVLGDGPLAVLDVLVRYARYWQLWLSLAVVGMLGIVVSKDWNSGVVVVFFLSALAAALVQGKLFEYHWIPALAPLAILAAVALVRLAEEGLPRGARANAGTLFALVAIGGMLLSTGYDHLVRYRRTAGFLLGSLTAEAYYASFDIGSDFSRTDTHRAAAYLQEHTAPSDTVFIWGVEPLVNWLAERRSSSRFISFYALVRGEDSNPRLGAWQREFMSELTQEPPVYVVLVENDRTPLAPAGSLAELDALPAFRAFLDEHYELEAQLGDYYFYHRR